VATLFGTFNVVTVSKIPDKKITPSSIVMLPFFFGKGGNVTNDINKITKIFLVNRDANQVFMAGIPLARAVKDENANVIVQRIQAMSSKFAGGGSLNFSHDRLLAGMPRDGDAQSGESLDADHRRHPPHTGIRLVESNPWNHTVGHHHHNPHYVKHMT
jgi:hypothetical protein